MARPTQAIPRLLARLRNWLTPPGGGDEEQAGFGRTVCILSLILMAALVPTVALNWAGGYLIAAQALCLEELCAAAAFWLARQGRLQAAASMLFFSLLGCALYLLPMSSVGFHNLAAMMLFPALLALASMLPEWRFYNLFATLEVLAVTASGLAEMRGWTRAAAALRVHTDFTLLGNVDVILIVTAVAGGLVVHHLKRSLSESRRNASALRHNEERYRTVIESLGEGVASTDAQERFLVANPAAELIFGVPPGGLVGRRLNEFVPPAEVPRLESEAARRRCGEKSSYELQIVRPDGAGRTLQVTVAPQCDPAGGAVRCVGVFRDITASRQAEERFRLLAHALASTSDCVCIIDAEDRILYANKAFCRTHGYEQSELQGQTIGIVRAARNDPRVVGQILPAALTGGWQGEIWCCAKDGREFPMALTTAAVRDDRGRAIARVGVARDITERKRAEQALLESEARLRGITDSAQDAILMMDPRGAISYWNPAAERILGYRREEAIGKILHDLLVPECYHEAHRLAFQEFLHTGRGTAVGKTVALTARRKDGREIAVELSLSAICLHGQWHAVGIIRDITERKRAEEKLQQSETRFRDLVENTSDLIWEMDAQSRYVYCSPATAEVLGVERTEVLGKTSLDFAAPEDLASQKSQHADLLANPRPFRGLELKKLHRDGSIRVLESSGVPIFDAAGRCTGYRGITRDITERKRAEEELRAAMVSAEAADRAKSEFLATIGHEIRTPMNGIIGMNELLLGTGLSSEQKSYCEALRSSSEALLAILNDVLDFSRIEAGKMELESIPFDLLACLEEVEDLVMASAHAKHLELALMFDRDVPRRVIADPGRIRQVLLNLAGNAIKFTERGSVWIEVACAHQSASRATIRMTVFDTGIGIAPDKLPLVFSRFTQADSSTTRRYGGTGLGLAIVKRLVDRMNGSIQVASQPGEGSAFAVTLSLPLDPAPEPEPVPPARLQGARALIVDDCAINRFVFLDLCLRWGMRADEACSGAEALRMVAAAERAGDPYGVILLDSNMPEMDGVEVARRLRASAESREPAIVMATSSAQTGEADRFRAAGCDGYLVKPIKAGLLQAALLRVLGARSAGLPQPLITDGSLIKLRDALAPAPPSAPKPFAGCRALLAEDNLINQKLATRLLEKLGCRVDLAVNGLEAVRLSADNDYDLVFMDCQMPEMDGFEATAEIRRREGTSRHTPIIAMTAFAMNGDRQRCLRAGMDDYISKPIRPGALEQALNTWFAHRGSAAPTEVLHPEDDLQTLA